MSDQELDFDDYFDRTADPMEEMEEAMRVVDTDDYAKTFGRFLENRVYVHEYDEDTNRWYEITLEQWQDFIEDKGRHPATPPAGSAKEFVEYLRDERENQRSSIEKKINILRKCFKFFNTAGKNGSPLIYDGVTFQEFEDVGEEVRLDPKKDKPVHDISEEEMGEIFRDKILHVRDRALILFQLKLGARAGEASNARLVDVKLNSAEIDGENGQYPEMGTHDFIEMEDPDGACVYIPNADERDGNKSKNGRLIPIDDELRRALKEYLLVRPDGGEPYLFLSKTTGTQLHISNVNEIWKKYFRPEYDEDKYRRAVVSHFGRHFFTTWWESDKRDMTRRDIQYLRGDGKETDEEGNIKKADSMDQYVHRYYGDIEQKYIDGVFKFGIAEGQEQSRVLELAEGDAV